MAHLASVTPLSQEGQGEGLQEDGAKPSAEPSTTMRIITAILVELGIR